MGSHSVTCHPTQVEAPRLAPAMRAGTRFTYPGGMEGWVDLVDLIAPRPGVEPATFRSRVWRRTAAPPRQPIVESSISVCLQSHTKRRNFARSSVSYLCNTWAGSLHLLLSSWITSLLTFLSRSLTLLSVVQSPCSDSSFWPNTHQFTESDFDITPNFQDTKYKQDYCECRF